MPLYKKGSSLPASLPSHRKIGVWSNIQIYLVLPTSLVSLYCGGFKSHFGKLISERSHTLNASSYLFSCYIGIIMLSPYLFSLIMSSIRKPIMTLKIIKLKDILLINEERENFIFLRTALCFLGLCYWRLLT